MSQDYERPDPDDMFAHTRMSLGDHIDELRTCLVRSIKGFFFALIIGFVVAEPVLGLIKYPVEKQLNEFYDRRMQDESEQLKDNKDDLNKSGNEPTAMRLEVNAKELAEVLDIPAPKKEWVTLNAKVRPNEIIAFTVKEMRRKIRPAFLTILSITESFLVWCKVSVYTGLVLSGPWIFYQIWSFIAAGLYPQEKKYVHIFLPFSIGLFLAGVFVCQFLVLPWGIHWLLEFSRWLNVEPELRLSEWLSFAILMPVLFGVAFQLPLVMLFLYKIDAVTIETYVANWRIAMFVIVIIAAFLAAAPDPYSTLAMAVPMGVLYFLGIFLCKMWPNPNFELEETDPEEMVEV